MQVVLTGIPLDANLSDVTKGTDQSAAIQAVLDTAVTSGPLELIIPGVVKAKDLKLHSNTTLRGLGQGTGIVQAPGGTSAIRNYNWVSPYNNQQIVDANICVRDLEINGNQQNASANTLAGTAHWSTNNNYLKATNAGVLVCPIEFYGVSGLTIENVYVRDPAAYHIHVANIDHGTFRDLRVNDSAHAAAPFNGPNTAGLQINGPANDIEVDGLYGNTSDDFLALNAEDWNLVSGGDPSLLLGPQLFGGNWNSVYMGPIVRVTARNLNMNTSSGIRLCSQSQLIDQVSISSVKGSATLYGLETNPSIPGYSAGNGNIGKVVLEDWDLPTLTDPGAIALVNVDAVITSLVLRNFRRGLMNSAADSIVVGPSASVGVLAVDGFAINELGTGSSANLLRMQAGVVNLLAISGIRWARGVSSTASVGVFNQTGGGINSLRLSDIIADRVTWIVVVTGGNVPEITTSGLKHTNSGGNASIVATGATIPRLRCSGSDTRLLTATGTGGAITSKKTDGTEDA